METTMTTPASDPALLLGRRMCYRFISLALADPQTGDWTELAAKATQTLLIQAAEILRDEEAAVAHPLALGERPIAEFDPTLALARLPKTREEWSNLYDRNFGLLGGSKCPPYETEYVPSKFTFQRSNMLADIAGFYHAFGLQTSTTHPDRPDHIALECEFAAQLLQLELLARQNSTPDAFTQAEICRQAHRRFVQEHIAWWFPAFSRLLTRQDPGGFYEAVANFLAAFVAAERALACLPVSNQPAEPSSIENPDACSGCELAMH